VIIKVIAGEVEGVKGALCEIYADPEYLDVSVPSGGFFQQPVKRGHTAFAYVFEGEGIFGEEEALVASTSLVILGEGDVFRVHAGANRVRFLLISGKPLNEPIARYGPFVMNSNEEIEQALEDLREGTFVK
jgi:redox-sensitive bicupin YhaK (pirin superfamily)